MPAQNNLLVVFLSGQGGLNDFRRLFPILFHVERRILPSDDANKHPADGIVGIVRLANSYFTADVLVTAAAAPLAPAAAPPHPARWHAAAASAQAVLLFVDALRIASDGSTPLRELPRLEYAICNVRDRLDTPIHRDGHHHADDPQWRDVVLLVVLYNAPDESELGNVAEEHVLRVIHEHRHVHHRFGFERIGRLDEEEPPGWQSVLESIHCAPWPETVECAGETESESENQSPAQDMEMEHMIRQVADLSTSTHAPDPDRIHTLSDLFSRLND